MKDMGDNHFKVGDRVTLSTRLTSGTRSWADLA